MNQYDTSMSAFKLGCAPALRKGFLLRAGVGLAFLRVPIEHSLWDFTQPPHTRIYYIYIHTLKKAPPKSNITMETQPFEDVSHLLKHGDFQPAMLVSRQLYIQKI